MSATGRDSPAAPAAPADPIGSGNRSRSERSSRSDGSDDGRERERDPASSDEQLGSWLDAELSEVNDELASLIRDALPPGWREVPLDAAPEALNGAAVRELRNLLGGDSDNRSSAPLLLAIDALVTYACELLATSGRDVAARAESMVDDIAAVLPRTDEAA